MAQDISDTANRVRYVATAAQTAFVVPFEFANNAHLEVYKNDTKLTLSTHYTLSGAGSTGGGTMTLVTGAALNDDILIVRDIPKERQGDFPVSGIFDVESLNSQLDNHVMMMKDTDTRLDRRVLGLSVTDLPEDLNDLPNKATRANKILGFDADGQPSVEANNAHTHQMSAINGLDAALALKASSTHTHPIADVSGLQSSLNGLQTAIDGKAASVHSHNDLYYTEAEVDGLLAGKTPFGHGHSMSDVAGLDTALLGKAAYAHTHTANDITDFGENVDDRVSSLLVAGPNVSLAYDDTTNKLTITSNTGSGSGVLDGTYADITVSGFGTQFNINAGAVGLPELGGGVTTFGKSLIDDADAAAARTTLGLGTAATQASTAFAAASHTHTIANITNLQTTLDGKAATSHTHTASQISDSTAAGRSLLTGADAAAQRTSLGLGTAATQASTAFAAAVHTHAIADVTGLQTALDAKLDDSQATAFGLSLLDDADAAAARSTLGLGALATKSAITNVDITDLTIGSADIADGAVLLSKMDRTGTNNYVLTAKGAGNAPVWQVSSGGASSLTAQFTRNLLNNVYTFDLSAGNVFNGTITRRPTISDNTDYVFNNVYDPITFVGSAGSTGTATHTLPSGIQQNDLIILLLGSDNTPPTIPAGWSTLYASGVAGTAYYAVAYLVAGSTPPTSVTVNISTTTDVVLSLVYRGVDTAAPFEVTSAVVVGAAMPDAPAITPLTYGARVLALGFIDDDNVTATAPSGFGNLAFQAASAAGFTVMSADRFSINNVSVDAAAFGGGGVDDTAAMAVSLKPSVVLGTNTLTLPTGLVEGDCVFLVTSYLHPATSNTIVSVPSGWNSLNAVSNDTAYGQTGYRFGVFYKFMGSTPDTTVVVNEGPLPAIHRVYVVKGLDSTQLIDVINFDSTNGFGDTRGFTTTQPYTLWFGGFGTPRLNTGVVATGFDAQDYNETSNGTNYIHLWTGFVNDPAAGAFDPAQVTGTAGAGTNSGSSWAVALRTAVPSIVFTNEPSQGLGYKCVIDVNMDSNTVTWPFNVTFEGAAGLTTAPAFTTTNFPGKATVFHLDKTEPVIPFAASGQAAFTTAGTYSWVVPAGVTSISAVSVGAGGGGLLASTGGGGGGGDLRYSTIAVTPGETLTIVVGAAGTTGASPTAGGFTRISRGGTVLLEAAGGGAGTATGTGTKNGTSTTIAGSVGGGNGGAAPASPAGGSTAGGGAGGYNGNGGSPTATASAAGVNAATGSGGGGSGGNGGTANDSGGTGGGVGILGLGADGVGGAGGVDSGADGTAGSGGVGPAYGGGSGGSDNTGVVPTAAGGGAARIIWGKTTGNVVRVYPATGTADHVTGFATTNLYRAKAHDTYPQAFY